MTNKGLAQTSADAVARLQADLEGDRTLRSEVERELHRIVSRMQDHERRISALQVATTALTHWVPPVADEQWCDDERGWRSVICEELLAIPKGDRTAKEAGAARNLAFALAMIDGTGGIQGSGYGIETSRLGELMREAGYEQVGADPVRNYGGTLPWYGSLPEVEQRIERATKERDDAQAQLDSALLLR
ncbi:MAG TPA: hypothetical protein VNJ04_18460 [Gemmatimonadaceae bacterium]|nr:hypothetical protein [Gemmatimonadaceae bacterium]